MHHVFASPPFHLGRSDFPSPVVPTPAAPVVRLPVSSHRNYGLPSRLTRSAISSIHSNFSMGEFQGCRHSLMFKPMDLLTTQVAPTEANISFFAEQPWLLHPNTSRFVTSPYPGYANRPIRATDGKRTCTSQDSQPCRQFHICFLYLPPDFPAVPHYFMPSICYCRAPYLLYVLVIHILIHHDGIGGRPIVSLGYDCNKSARGIAIVNPCP